MLYDLCYLGISNSLNMVPKERKTTSQLNDSQQRVITTDIKGAEVWHDDDV